MLTRIRAEEIKNNRPWNLWRDMYVPEDSLEQTVDALLKCAPDKLRCNDLLGCLETYKRESLADELSFSYFYAFCWDVLNIDLFQVFNYFRSDLENAKYRRLFGLEPHQLIFTYAPRNRNIILPKQLFTFNNDYRYVKAYYVSTIEIEEGVTSLEKFNYHNPWIDSHQYIKLLLPSTLEVFDIEQVLKFPASYRGLYFVFKPVEINGEFVSPFEIDEDKLNYEDFTGKSLKQQFIAIR